MPQGCHEALIPRQDRPDLRHVLMTEIPGARRHEDMRVLKVRRPDGEPNQVNGGPSVLRTVRDPAKAVLRVQEELPEVPDR